MPNYIVNRKSQDNSHGEHEVHNMDANCGHLPDHKNRVNLGWHPNCSDALYDAEEKGYKPADGCAYCCPECHKH